MLYDLCKSLKGDLGKLVYTYKWMELPYAVVINIFFHIYPSLKILTLFKSTSYTV